MTVRIYCWLVDWSSSYSEPESLNSGQRKHFLFFCEQKTIQTSPVDSIRSFHMFNKTHTVYTHRYTHMLTHPVRIVTASLTNYSSCSLQLSGSGSDVGSIWHLRRRQCSSCPPYVPDLIYSCFLFSSLTFTHPSPSQINKPLSNLLITHCKINSLPASCCCDLAAGRSSEPLWTSCLFPWLFYDCISVSVCLDGFLCLIRAVHQQQLQDKQTKAEVLSSVLS